MLLERKLVGDRFFDLIFIIVKRGRFLWYMCMCYVVFFFIEGISFKYCLRFIYFCDGFRFLIFLGCGN